MSAAPVRSQLSINTRKALHALARRRKPTDKSMADVSLLPPWHDLQIVRLAHTSQWWSDGPAKAYVLPDIVDDLDGIMTHEDNVWFSAYYQMVKTVSARKDKRVSYDDVLCALQGDHPTWSGTRITKAANRVWFEIASVTGWEMKVDAYVDACEAAIVNQERRAAALALSQ